MYTHHNQSTQTGAAAPRALAPAEYETVIQQQAASLQRKDAMLARLNRLAAQVKAVTGKPVPGYVEPRRRALLS